MSKRVHEKGFILLELLVSLPLLSLLLTAMSALFLFGMKQYFQQLAQVELQQEIQMSMQRIVADVSEAQAVQVENNGRYLCVYKRPDINGVQKKTIYHLHTMGAVRKLVQGDDNAAPMTGNHALAWVTITDFTCQENQGLVHLHLAGKSLMMEEAYEISTAVFIPVAATAS